MKIERRNGGIFLSQEAYVHRVVDATGMSHCKQTKTPLPHPHPLYRGRVVTNDEQHLYMPKCPYRIISGSQIYLSTRTRPDIVTMVSMLGQFQADPGVSDWKALKYLLKYLKITVDYGISLCTSDLDHSLHSYSDVD